MIVILICNGQLVGSLSPSLVPARGYRRSVLRLLSGKGRDTGRDTGTTFRSCSDSPSKLPIKTAFDTHLCSLTSEDAGATSVTVFRTLDAVERDAGQRWKRAADCLTSGNAMLVDVRVLLPSMCNATRIRSTSYRALLGSCALHPQNALFLSDGSPHCVKRLPQVLAIVFVLISLRTVAQLSGVHWYIGWRLCASRCRVWDTFTEHADVWIRER